MFAETERDLKQLVGIKHADAYFATVMTATGTGANEACLLALEPLGKGLILNNGFFARARRRSGEAERHRASRCSSRRRIARSIPRRRGAARRATRRSSGCSSSATRRAPACATRSRRSAGRASSAAACVAADVISSAYAYPIDSRPSQVDLVDRIVARRRSWRRRASASCSRRRRRSPRSKRGRPPARLLPRRRRRVREAGQPSRSRGSRSRSRSTPRSTPRARTCARSGIDAPHGAHPAPDDRR